VATNSITLAGDSNTWVVDLLASIIHPLLPFRVPYPVVRAAVAVAVKYANEIDPSDVAAILERLGAPTGLVTTVWPTFVDTVEETTCEVECPQSGNTITLDDGDGFYDCPDCSQDIEVEDGVGYHPYLEECAVTGEAYWIPAEEGSYACPECATTVRIRGSTVTHGSPARGLRRRPPPARRAVRK